MCPTRACLVPQERCTVNPAALEARLRTLGFDDAEVVSLERLGKEGQALKGLGYGEPVRVRFVARGKEHSVVLRTVASSWYGHDRRADRMAEVLLCFDTFGGLPAHVRALDVGAMYPGGGLVSLRGAAEPYLITEYAEGRLYAEDLRELGARGEATQRDVERVDALVDTVTAIHLQPRERRSTPAPSASAVRGPADEKTPPPAEGRGKSAAPFARALDSSSRDPLYRRAIRDLVGHGEGTFGIVDGYGSECAVAPAARLEAIEHAMLRWRWRLRGHEHRLRSTHGDFHPFNVLFREGVDLSLLDRSRGGCGDPADDVACMTVNYLFFALRFPGSWRAGFSRLWGRFWERYLGTTTDDEMLEVIAPFYAWRALVVASPAWYPDLGDEVRDKLLRFAEDALGSTKLDPSAVERFVE